ncbi:hypothetical protein CLV30_102165 [Haloactinopolyspora alba]|uniref:Bacterial transcriptional activator domain-containing protein n=1 Tax=Haloactinopolyspora alba TaxID=648780 RepID=A0A2P8EBH0_9ACTN|nr:hypothetical protein [Haloactinopolyspora alba]PSL06777.1 hypothetical protein CLV30_102165 [Haloactinopolyspora alba]
MSREQRDRGTGGARRAGRRANAASRDVRPVSPDEVTPASTVRETGPQRFQQRQAADPERGGFQAFAAGLALLFLVAGVPAALILLGGAPPIPTSWPGRAELTGTIGAEQLVGVLLWVVWLAWLQFLVCVLTELRSGLRGVGLPNRVPLSGPTQRFARVLVASVLVATAAVGQASAAAPGTNDTPAPSTSTSVSASAEADTGTEYDGTVRGSVQEQSGASAQQQEQAQAQAEGEVEYRLGDMVLDEEEGRELVGRKVYVVQPPEGRYHDNLWDIAERTLGDGRRYQEIYELNRGRTQPDGHELSLARLIYPNWLLIVPDDAKGVPTVTAEKPAPPETPAPPATPPGPPGQEGTQGTEGTGQAEADTGGADMFADFAAAGEAEAISTNPHAGLADAGLLAAGVLAAIEVLRRRRRTPEPTDDEVEAEVALRIGADPDRARWLDHALRSLAAGCQQERLALPPVYAAVVDNTSVELLLAPARAEAPSPWAVMDDGRRWRLDRSEVKVGDELSGNVLAPYPGLVSLGRNGERDLLVDLEAAGGPISVDGDPEATIEVVTALAVELATNQWSDHLRVTADGLPEALDAFDSGRLRLVDGVEPMLPELAARRSDRLGTDVLTGRVRPGGSGSWMPEYLVLGTPPSAELAEQLVALTSAAGRSPLGVIAAGAIPGARWRISVDASGTLELPALGLSVQANRLSWRSIDALVGLVDPERGQEPDPSGGGLPGAWSPDLRPEVPQVRSVVAEADLATAPVRVYILGPVVVQARSEIEEERRALATEIIVHLALHREGVHPTVLASAVWPQGVTASVREATFARVREWLGVDQSGSPYVLMTEDGRMRLSDAVVLDWDVVCSLLSQARQVRRPAEEADLLRRALRVARGPVLSERPQGRYSWLARARVERVASDLLVDAAHRLSNITLEGGDPGTAGASARAGLRVRPSEQVLWRDLLQAQHAVDGRGGVIAVESEMTETLTGLGGVALAPETVALLDELMPSPGGRHRDLA